MTARFSWNQQNTRGHRPRLQFEIVIECTFGTLSSYEGSFHSCPSSTSPNLGALKADLDAVAKDADVTVMTATDFGSRPADVVRIRERYGIMLPEIPLARARLPLTAAQNQIPVTLLFRHGMLVDRRLGAQSYDALRSWVQTALALR